MMLLGSLLVAQFGDVDVVVDVQRLKGKDRRITAGIAEQIQLLFETTPWDEEYSDLEIPLSLQLFFEGVSERGGQRIYAARTFFSNGSDQRYASKTIQFPYSAGQGVAYSPVIFEPLSGAMEYCAYLILAGEADTYAQLGGTRFYDRCREIVLRGLSSEYSRGWNERMNLVDQLYDNKGLRLAKFYFYEAEALMYDRKFAEAEKSYAEMLKNLKLALNEFPIKHYTLIFLDAHATEFANLPPAIGNKSQILQALIDMDPQNTERYQRGLNPKSE